MRNSHAEHPLEHSPTQVQLVEPTASHESQVKSTAGGPLPRSTLILIAHGSRNPRWRGSVEKLMESLQTELGPDKVRLAYMECAPPTLADVASQAVRAGIRRIRVLPLFLAGEGHVARNIRPVIDQLHKTHGPVELELLPPVGQHPLFRELLRSIAVEEAD
jgi:sirohydrochlorin cobaltochelatase